jgi:hypothetical protein
MVIMTLYMRESRQHHIRMLLVSFLMLVVAITVRAPYQGPQFYQALNLLFALAPCRPLDPGIAGVHHSESG